MINVIVIVAMVFVLASMILLFGDFPFEAGLPPATQYVLMGIGAVLVWIAEALNSAAKAKRARRGKLVDRPLSAKDLEYYKGRVEEGYRLLAVPSTESPDAILSSIGHSIRALQQRGVDHTTETATLSALGAVLNEQFVRAFGWQWAHVNFEDDNAIHILLERGLKLGENVVSPDRALRLNGWNHILDCLGDPPKSFAGVVACFQAVRAAQFSHIGPGKLIEITNALRR